MTHLATTPPDDNNDANQGSDEEEKIPDLDTNETAATPAEESKPVPLASSSQDRSTSLDDITAIRFEPSLPSKGPMSKFVKSASGDFGIPFSHAWAVWIFATMASSGHNIFYNDGCTERRITPNIILAGDDESGLVRRIAVEVLERNENVKVYTNSAVLQTLGILEGFSSDVRRVLVDTGDENLFLRWHKKVSKQEISLAQLFCGDSLNDYLAEKIRARSMPPASLPVLLSCKLREILSDRKFPFCVFRDSLVVPSFGGQQQRSFTAEAMEQLLKLLGDSFIEIPNELFLTLTPHAQEELDAYMRVCSMRLIGLNQEGGDAHYRSVNLTYKVLCLATAYAINETGEAFDGKISKSVMQLAISSYEKLDERWDAIDGLYEEASRADEVDNVYDMVLARFANYHDEHCGGLVVPFQELAKAFCHHPDREGQFTTGYLEQKVLSNIVMGGRAKQLHGRSRRDRKWVFYTQKRLNRG